MNRVTATILFTDIVASTRSWEEDPEAMAVMVAAHDDLVGEVVAAQGGTLVKGLGDGILASFDSAGVAITAAVEIQRRLESSNLEVRIGLHTGDVEVRGEDIFGPAVNRAARLMAAAHGGQVVVSSATASAAGPRPGEGITLVDLGVHRLKDLAAPDRVFEVAHPDLRSSFPPLASLNPKKTNLPVQLTPIVGREDEVARVLDLLASHRLVTITGPGGVGKTRTALAVAAEASDWHADGTWWVELAEHTRVDAVRALAAAIGVEEASDQSLVASIAAEVGDQQVLVVADNLEHVLDAGTEIASMLASTTGLRFLCTSRIPLGLRGEVTYRLDPLASDGDGTELFTVRASEANPRIDWSPANREAARAIVKRLEGLPLAIELAAAQARVLPPTAIADLVVEHLGSLRGKGDALTHHRTIDDLVEWSYRLLNPSQAALFECLSVFAGSFEVEAAVAVAAGHVDGSPVIGLLDLADQSLLQPVVDDVPRFRMLATVKSHARRRLEESGRSADVEEAHTRWFLQLARSSEGLLRGADQESWHQRLELDLDEFRLVRRRLLAAGDIERALAMAADLGRFWWHQGRSVEALEWYDAILPLAEGNPTSDLALALVWRTSMLHQMGLVSADQMERLLAEAEDVATASGATLALAYVANNRAIQALGAEDLHGAAAGFRLAVGLLEELDPSWTTPPSSNLSVTLIELGRLEEGVEVARGLLARAEATGERWGIDSARFLLAEVAMHRLDLDRAEAGFREALEGFRSFNTAVDVFNTLEKLAQVAAERGDVEGADRFINEAESVAESMAMVLSPGLVIPRATARVMDGRSAEALGLLAGAAGRTGETISDSYRLCLSAAEVLTDLDRVEEAAWFLAVHDGWAVRQGVTLTPLWNLHRDRVLDRVGPLPHPPASLAVAMSTLAGLAGG